MGTTSKEAVELHQELEVDIFALRSLTVRVPDVLVLEVDTYPTENPKVSLLDFVCSSGSTLVLSPFLQAETSDAMAQECSNSAPHSHTNTLDSYAPIVVD